MINKSRGIIISNINSREACGVVPVISEAAVQAILLSAFNCLCIVLPIIALLHTTHRHIMQL